MCVCSYESRVRVRARVRAAVRSATPYGSRRDVLSCRTTLVKQWGSPFNKWNGLRHGGARERALPASGREGCEKERKREERGASDTMTLKSARYSSGDKFQLNCAAVGVAKLCVKSPVARSRRSREGAAH